MTQIAHEYTIAAMLETQRSLTERCKLQHLKVLRDTAHDAQIEYQEELMRY